MSYRRITIEYKARLDALEEYPTIVKDTLFAADGDEQLADLLGVLDRNTRMVSAERKIALSEIPDEVTGSRYTMALKGGKYDRSYNFSTLLSKLMDGTGLKLLELLIYLREQDVLRISWQWTNLTKIAREYNVELTIQSGGLPVVDGDNADVGQKWKDGSPGFTRIEES